MMAILAMAVAKFFDPIFFVLALIASYWLRQWWAVAITGFALACVYQLLLGQSGGQGFVAAWIAMTAQAAVAVAMFRFIHYRRAGGAANR